MVAACLNQFRHIAKVSMQRPIKGFEFEPARGLFNPDQIALGLKCKATQERWPELMVIDKRPMLTWGAWSVCVCVCVC